MLTNNLKLAFRQISKNRLYAAINILGLAIGITAALLIYRILHFELSFNRHFENHDRIVRGVFVVTGTENGVIRGRGLPIPGMIALANEVPQFAYTSRIHEDWPTITVPNPLGGAPLKKTEPQESQISFFVEPSFLKIFDFKWLAGNPESALNNAGDIVLTRKQAEYCFEKVENALGKVLVMNNTVPCTVRGVIEDLPPNCDFPIFSLASYATLLANKDLYFFSDNDWGGVSSNDQFFALLNDPAQFAIANSLTNKIGDKELNQGNSSDNKAYFELQPIRELHYDEEAGNAGSHTISKSRLWVLASIGFLVLLMACFNFINLATALASLRAREVGVRKAVGGDRSTLIAQFMTETSLIVGLAIAVSIGLAAFCKPLLKHISEVPDSQPFFTDPNIWMFIGGVGILVAILSGVYPSLVLSGYNPIKALRNNISQSSGGGAWLRKGLVVAQFSIAQALIIGAIVIVSQLNYVRNMDMGFDKNLVLTTSFNNDSATLVKLEGLEQRIRQIPTVEHVSFSADQPSSNSTWSTNFSVDRGSKDAPFNTSLKMCDANFLATFGLKMKAGNWFQPSDTAQAYVVNETLCRKLGIVPVESAIGKELRLGGGRWRPIVGVVKDFHSHSAHSDHEPLVMAPKKIFYSDIGIKIRPENISRTVEAVRKVYDETFPEQVFKSEFYDESIANFYQLEARFSDFSKGVAALAILIGCLGLFGLATHAASRRTKEIGVRKSLGASVFNITALLTIDFLKLVLVAILIAVPVSYYLMQKWLSDFVFRIQLEWWMFAVSCLGAIAVAFLTVSYQSIRAALANPVDSLRSE
jgi:predicted permease